MAQAQFLRRSAFIVLGGGGSVLVASQIPRRTAWAEAPSTDDLPEKKPIYGTHVLPPAASKPSPTSPVSKPNPENPTPTDRLTAQIKRARLFLYDQSLSAEDQFNSFLTWTFKKETNFANTVASLAPAPETGEQLLPGAIYVLVATMAGSIVARNRGIFLRATFPVAVGITAGWMLIPVTMRNTADLIWEYEKKVPAISETHMQIRGFTQEAWKQVRTRGELVKKWSEDSASQTRSKVEGWVEKGK